MADYNKCTSCKANEGELEYAIKESHRIKRENDELRETLKEMSRQLDQTLVAKQKAQQNTKPVVLLDSRVEVIEQQIKNTTRQIENYKKQLQSFKKKQKGDYSVQKIAEMQQQIIDKKKELKDLKSENKSLEITKRNTEKSLLNDNAEKMLTGTRNEVMGLNQRVSQMKKWKEKGELNYETTEQMITDILAKQEEVCGELGIENKPLERPTEEIFKKKEEEQAYIDSDDSDAEQKKEKKKMKYDDFMKLENHIRILKESIQQNEKKHLYNVEQLEGQIKNIENQKIDLKDQLHSRKKNLEATQAKLKEIQDSMKQSSYIDMGMFIRKEQNIRRIQAGIKVYSDNARAYKDIEDLAFPEDMYISEVSVTSYHNYIIGLEAVYRNRKGLEKQRIKCFQPSREIEGSVTQTMKLTSIEHISQVTGYYSIHIEYIKIMTTRGQYIYGGSDKAYLNCNKFSLDIRKDEKPTSFFGIVDFLTKKKRKNKEQQQIEKNLNGEYVLISMGLECRKKEAPQARMDAFKIQQLQQQQQQEQEDDDDDALESDNNNNNDQQSQQQDNNPDEDQNNEDDDDNNDQNNSDNNNNDDDQQDESYSQKDKENENDSDEDNNDKVVL